MQGALRHGIGTQTTNGTSVGRAAIAEYARGYQDAMREVLAKWTDEGVQAQDRLSEANGEGVGADGPDTCWPWDLVSFKDSDDELRSLAKAGALLAGRIRCRACSTIICRPPKTTSPLKVSSKGGNVIGDDLDWFSYPRPGPVRRCDMPK